MADEPDWAETKRASARVAAAAAWRNSRTEETVVVAIAGVLIAAGGVAIDQGVFGLFAALALLAVVFYYRVHPRYRERRRIVEAIVPNLRRELAEAQQTLAAREAAVAERVAAVAAREADRLAVDAEARKARFERLGHAIQAVRSLSGSFESMQRLMVNHHFVHLVEAAWTPLLSDDEVSRWRELAAKGAAGDIAGQYASLLILAAGEAQQASAADIPKTWEDLRDVASEGGLDALVQAAKKMLDAMRSAIFVETDRVLAEHIGFRDASERQLQELGNLIDHYPPLDT